MGNGKYSTIRIEYSWTPQCCSNCKLFGHNLAHCHIMKSKDGTNMKEVGEEASMAEERKTTQMKGAESRKDPPDVMGFDVAGSVVDSIVESRGAGEQAIMSIVEVNETTNGDVVSPKLPGNKFECLARSEEDCPSAVAKNLDVSRSDTNAYADFSDTSPTLDTFKHVKRIDELDFTPVPLSKKKLKKLKKQNHASKLAPVVGGSIHISNG